MAKMPSQQELHDRNIDPDHDTKMNPVLTTVTNNKNSKLKQKQPCPISSSRG